jgi:hypothetical protein
LIPTVAGWQSARRLRDDSGEKEPDRQPTRAKNRCAGWHLYGTFSHY